jgi:hypothetical protein
MSDIVSKLNKLSVSMNNATPLLDSFINGENPIENIIIGLNDYQNDIHELKKIYENKLKEIDCLYKEILLKDEQINQLNNNNYFSNDFNKEKVNPEIEEIFQIDKENNEQLKSELLKLKDEYNQQIQSISNENDLKIKKLRNEIQSLKEQIDVYSDKEKYISKEEHEQILSELKKKHKKELEPFENEIKELEKFISENYPNVLLNNKENNNELFSNLNNSNSNDISSRINNNYLDSMNINSSINMKKSENISSISAFVDDINNESNLDINKKGINNFNSKKCFDNIHK